MRRLILSAVVAAFLSLSMIFPALAENLPSDGYEWEFTDGQWSCTDSRGEPVSGWAVRTDEKDGTELTYYLDREGVMKTGWLKDDKDGNWYYLYEENEDEELVGTLATDTWIDNYYVDRDGVRDARKSRNFFKK